MNWKSLVILVVIIGIPIGAGVLLSRNDATQNTAPHHVASQPQPVVPEAAEIPAHYTSPPRLSSLAPTLEPEEFPGKAREAYAVARAIPQTLAQLPCYCHCDRGMGHKSLHSCFEDDHAAHCATCIDEALLAYRLEKEDKLSAEQIREKIIERFRM